MDANGEKCSTMHSVFGVATEMTNPELWTDIASLKEKYIQIEYDPNLSIEDKIPRELSA